MHEFKCLSTSRDQARAPVALFSVVRNERRILPHFVAHYRQLGVTEFYFVDNESDDGTTEWLIAQSDATVFSTGQRFSDSHCGTDWINTLIQEFGIDRWCLHVDADEFFCYAGCEQTPIHTYAAELDREGARGVFAFMLDFYPEGRLHEAVIDDSCPPREVCPLFDRDYVFRREPRKPWAKKGFPEHEVLGGPRMRLWGTPLEREARATWLTYFARGQIDCVIEWVPSFAFERFVRLFERQPPHLQKVPFVRPTGGFAYYMNAHSCSPVPLAERTAVLLHFKFTADFYYEVTAAAARGEHFRRGSQYIRYRRLLVDEGKGQLSYEGSTAYRSSAQLAQLGQIDRRLA